MKHQRLMLAVLAIAASGTWAVVAVACDGNKTQASATSSNGAKTQMSAAECQAKMAAGQGCSMHGVSAATASASGQCSAHGNSATTAMAKPAANGMVPAVAAGSVPECCASKSGASAASASKASAAGQCAAKGSASATAVGVAGQCSGHGMMVGASTATMTHGDCDACDDLGACEQELSNAGATMQTVPLKNGVMFVYSASNPGGVSAIQSAMARRGEHLSRIVAGGDKSKLCDECKSMRGAMASGKLVREVVNIEGGTLVLVTSSDAALVKKIRAMADASKMASIKS